MSSLFAADCFLEELRHLAIRRRIRSLIVLEVVAEVGSWFARQSSNIEVMMGPWVHDQPHRGPHASSLAHHLAAIGGGCPIVKFTDENERWGIHVGPVAYRIVGHGRSEAMRSLRTGCIQCKRAQNNGAALRGPNDGDAISTNKILDSEVIKGA